MGRTQEGEEEWHENPSTECLQSQEHAGCVVLELWESNECGCEVEAREFAVVFGVEEDMQGSVVSDEAKPEALHFDRAGLSAAEDEAAEGEQFPEGCRPRKTSDLACHQYDGR